MKVSVILIAALLCCSLAVHAQGSDVLAKAKAQYAAGKEDYYNGKYAAAQKHLKKSLALYRKVKGYDTIPAFAKTHWRLASAYRRNREHKLALSRYDSASIYYRKHTEQDALVFAEIDFDRARLYSQMYRPKLAMATYAAVRQAYEKEYGKESEEVGNLLMNVSIDQIKRGNYKHAETQLLEALAIFNVTSDSTDANFNRVFSNLGVLYRRMGDFERSVSYGKRALTIKKLNYPPNHPSIGKYYNNIGRALQAQGKYPEAIEYIKQALDLSKRANGENHPTTAGQYGELSNVYADAGQPQKAKRLMLKAVKGYANHYDAWHPYRVGGTYNLGRLEEDIGNFDEAISAYQQSIVQLRTGPEPSSVRLSRAHERIGHVLKKQGKFDLAKTAIDSALIFIAPELLALLQHQEEDATKKAEVIARLQNELEAIDLLDERSETWMRAGTASENIEELKVALLSAELAVELVLQLRSTFPTEESRRFLRESAGKVYTSGAVSAQRLYQLTGETSYLARALALSNAGKSGSLRDHLREDEISRLAGISTEDSESIAVLRDTYRSARAQYASSTTSIRGEELSKAAFELQQKRGELIQRYPRYKSLSAQVSGLALDALKREIPVGSVVLDYQLTSEEVLIVVLSQKQANMHAVQRSEAFDGALKYVLDHLDDVSPTRADRDSLVSSLQVVYETLISPIAPELKQSDGLIICPDGQLHELPFELLIQPSKAGEAADFRSMPYLIRAFSVSYLGAPELLMHDEAQIADFAVEVLAVAPSFERGVAKNRASLGVLTYAQDEVAQISNYFKAQTITGADANRALVEEWADKAQILHFATHGILDDNEPLASGFYLSPAQDGSDDADGFVSAAEVYGMKLRSQLAVLSACHSAAGVLQEGEGALSLARAFTFAGSESVVASRWLANDRSTSIVLERFYALLHEGVSRTDALRQAKLDYLAKADALTAHPFYWGGLMLSGEDSELVKANDIKWYLFILLGLVGGLVWGLRKLGLKS